MENEVLDGIHDRFTEIVFESSIRIHSFQEGRGISGMKGLDGKVCYLSLCAISDHAN